MRYDEINLKDIFNLGGYTGSNNQFIGLSGSTLNWLDFPQISAYGDRIVYCNSLTFSATASGENLINAYTKAHSFTVDTVNRGAVLVSPGIYDFDTNSLNLTASNVDIIGLSTDANSVLLKATNAEYTLKYWQGVNSGLYNVSLAGGTTLSILGSASTYLRWDNVIVSGNCFSSGQSTWAFENLNGEFRNIRVKPDTGFGTGKYSINAIFDQIYIENQTTSATHFLISNDANIVSELGFSSVTVSNVNGGRFDNLLQIAGTSSIWLENIKLGDGNYLGYCIGGDHIIYCNNVEVKNIDVIFFYGDFVNSSFKNIKIGNGPSVLSGQKIINTIVDNLTCGNITNDLFFANQGDITGTFSNITAGNVGSFVSSGNSVNANFSNIKVGNTSIAFYGIFGLTGKYNNIEIGDGADEILFNSFAGTIAGVFSNITVGNNNRIFRAAVSIEGTFDNIRTSTSCGLAFETDGYISGTFKNLYFGNVSTMFSAQGGFSGEFENINAGDVSLGFINVSSEIQGNYKDITIGNAQNFFYSSSSSLNLNLTNLVAGDISGAFFLAVGGDIIANVKNVKVGQIGTFPFSTSDGIYGKFDNISIDGHTEGLFIADGNIDGVFSNISSKELGSPLGIFLTTGGSISGTFSNFKFSESGDCFRAPLGEIIGYFENVFLESSQIFRLFICLTSNLNRVLRNFNTVGYDFDQTSNNIFGGKILDSSFDVRGLDNGSTEMILLQGGSILERCVFLGNFYAGGKTIASDGNVQISFTRGNHGISTNNLITTPYNIEE